MILPDMDQIRPEDPLSPRERECVHLSRLHSDKEIAARLGISLPTVKTHLANARRKLGAPLRRPPTRADHDHPLSINPSRPIPDTPFAEPDVALPGQSIGAEAMQVEVRDERTPFLHPPRLSSTVEVLHDLMFKARPGLLLLTPIALGVLVLIVIAIFGEFDSHVLPKIFPNYRP